MLGGWFDSARCPIGLDLGSHSVKMLQLAQRDGGYAVTAALRRTLPRDLALDAPERQEVLAETIRGMLDQGGFVGRRVVSCLPAAAIQYKNLRVPRMPAEELRAAVEFEAGERLQLPRGEAILQFIDAGEVRQGEDLREEIILMAVPAQAVQAHLHLLTQCDLQPAAIDAVPSALARCVTAQDGGTSDTQARVFLDVGYDSTKVLILRNGRVVFFKLIDIGGRKFDETVAARLGVPAHEAGDIRRRLASGGGSGGAGGGGGGRTDSVDRTVFEALRSIAGYLAREVALCLRYYSVTFRGQRPDTATLVGGEAYESQLAKVFTDDAGIVVEGGRPLEGIELGDVAELVQGPPALSEWAVAAGLSMRPMTRAAKRGAA